jgi:putative ABC transport system permease protein
MNTLLQDFRYAVRQIVQHPSFTIIAVLTLALGIGANTAIFSVVNAVLLRPLPYPQAERIVYLNEVSSGIDQSIALPDYIDWRKDAKSFQQLALSRLESRNLSGIPGREAERVAVAFVTANFFNVIGLNPQVGRTFTEDEDKPGAPALVVLSDRLWDRAFNRDPNIVGRTVSFHGQPSTVIGVMPREMDSPQRERRMAKPRQSSDVLRLGPTEGGSDHRTGAQRNSNHRGTPRKNLSGNQCRHGRKGKNITR